MVHDHSPTYHKTSSKECVSGSAWPGVSGGLADLNIPYCFDFVLKRYGTHAFLRDREGNIINLGEEAKCTVLQTKVDHCGLLHEDGKDIKNQHGAYTEMEETSKKPLPHRGMGAKIKYLRVISVNCCIRRKYELVYGRLIPIEGYSFPECLCLLKNSIPL